VFPTHRPRRLRRTPALRRLVAETSLEPRHLVLPMFVADGIDNTVRGWGELVLRVRVPIAGLRNAWQSKTPLTFSTDADYFVPGKTRGEVAIEFIETWKAAGIPPADILRAMTTNGYKVSETEKTRGPIRSGLAADLIAVTGNPLESIDALRDVRFVMKDGLVFKRDGVIVPGPFFNPGPVKGWRIR